MVCQRALIIHEGRIVAEETMADLAGDAARVGARARTLEEAFIEAIASEKDGGP